MKAPYVLVATALVFLSVGFPRGCCQQADQQQQSQDQQQKDEQQQQQQQPQDQQQHVVPTSDQGAASQQYDDGATAAGDDADYYYDYPLPILNKCCGAGETFDLSPSANSDSLCVPAPQPQSQQFSYAEGLVSFLKH